jgi:alpha-L-rhamnosidase
MQRTGTFTCDHPLLDQLHRNVVWGMRGNFVDVPTDCPQRDERLGWTGDLQVFAPAAAYLYDVSGMLGNWLDDLAADQRADGSVPVFVPTLEPMLPMLAAGWSDAVTVVPTELAYAYDDLGMLERHYESMRRWVDYVDGAAGPRRLWLHGFQFGDWLDPDAPERQPYKAKTDARLVASAYFALSTQLVADAATLLGHHADADRYGALAEEIRAAFRDEYLTPRGRLMSDTATAYALALRFGLISDDDARRRVAASLARSVKESFYTISSGFLGTPQVLAALSDAGDELSAYRLLTQTGLPSWLYPVTMGATTIWERWDSLLPDGSVNGTGMTSFNHYAFGAVADWMHRHIGGLAPLERGYRTLLVAPLPGPGVTSARASLRTPYGTAECEWSLAGTDVSLRVLVPPNTTAVVVRPGVTDDRQNPVRVAAGRHEWGYDVGRETVVAWSDPEWQAMFE